MVALLLASTLMPSKSYALSEKFQGFILGAVIAGILLNNDKKDTGVEIQVERPFCYFRPYYDSKGNYLGKKHECKYN